MATTKLIDKTGNYSIIIDRTTVTVKVVDCAAGIDRAITNFNVSNIVVVIDYKSVGPGRTERYINYKNELLVLFGGNGAHCLVIYLDYLNEQVPESLQRFLRDPNKCFVKASSMGHGPYWFTSKYGHIPIATGELAAKVLNKPDLYNSSLSQIASTAGVQLQDLNVSNDYSSEVRVKQSYQRVLTPEQMKKVVIDPYASYKIGVKLLCSN